MYSFGNNLCVLSIVAATIIIALHVVWKINSFVNLKKAIFVFVRYITKLRTDAFSLFFLEVEYIP